MVERQTRLTQNQVPQGVSVRIRSGARPAINKVIISHFTNHYDTLRKVTGILGNVSGMCYSRAMTKTLEAVSHEDIGCIIDGSHWSVLDFTTAVIDLAMSNGFDEHTDVDLYRSDLDRLANDALDDEEILDIREALDDLYYDALDYMNYVVTDSFYLYVDESCLFLTCTDYCEKGIL